MSHTIFNTKLSRSFTVQADTHILPGGSPVTLYVRDTQFDKIIVSCLTTDESRRLGQALLDAAEEADRPVTHPDFEIGDDVIVCERLPGGRPNTSWWAVPAKVVSYAEYKSGRRGNYSVSDEQNVPLRLTERANSVYDKGDYVAWGSEYLVRPPD